MTETYQSQHRHISKSIHRKFTTSLILVIVTLPFWYIDNTPTTLVCFLCNNDNSIVFKVLPIATVILYNVPLMWLYSYLSIYFSDFVYVIDTLRIKITHYVKNYKNKNGSISNNSQSLNNNNGNSNNIDIDLISEYKAIYTYINDFLNIWNIFIIVTTIICFGLTWIFLDPWQFCFQHGQMCLITTAETVTFALILIGIILVLLKGIYITHTFEHLKKSIANTLDDLLLSSYNINNNDNNNNDTRLILILSRLNALTVQKPLHFNVFGIKLDHKKIFSVCIGFAVSRALSFWIKFYK